jgi:hypothetical protein
MDLYCLVSVLAHELTVLVWQAFSDKSHSQADTVCNLYRAAVQLTYCLAFATYHMRTENRTAVPSSRHMLGGVWFATILTYLKAVICTVLHIGTLLFIEMHSEFHEL